jgi:hypothetical protein
MQVTDDLVKKVKDDIQHLVDAEMKALVVEPTERKAGKIQGYNKALSVLADTAKRFRLDGGDDE